MILDEILARKRVEVVDRRRAVPIDRLRDAPGYQAARRGFRAALAAARPPGVIAELKRTSPSRGRIREDYDPPAHARSYEAAGACCLSVLTDEHFFEGALSHLSAVHAAVSLPCLRKDFVVDAYQIDEARAAGADAVLLIAAALSSTERTNLAGYAAEAGLDVLIEVHDEDEMAWVVDAKATLVGVNNRDLRTFETRLETTERLAPFAPPEALVVAESGIRVRSDVDRMLAAGARAVLVGETFMRAPDPGAALRDLLACP